jgi:hypothetical protein
MRPTSGLRPVRLCLFGCADTCCRTVSPSRCWNTFVRRLRRYRRPSGEHPVALTTVIAQHGQAGMSGAQARPVSAQRRGPLSGVRAPADDLPAAAFPRAAPSGAPHNRARAVVSSTGAAAVDGPPFGPHAAIHRAGRLNSIAGRPGAAAQIRMTVARCCWTRGGEVKRLNLEGDSLPGIRLRPGETSLPLLSGHRLLQPLLPQPDLFLYPATICACGRGWDRPTSSWIAM